MTTQEKAQPLVAGSIKAPKIKLDGKKATCINAFTTAFACFFGGTVIFSAISHFTHGDWSFSIPFIHPFLGSNLGPVNDILVLGLLALFCALVGLFTVRKITNAEQMKQSWQKVAKVFAVVAVIFGINMIAIILYSLLSLGRKSYDFSQGELWGSNFVANLILAVMSGAMYFVSTKISKGETKYLSVLRYVALGIGIVAFVMAIVALLVGFYSKSSGSVDIRDYGLDDLYDLFSD